MCYTAILLNIKKKLGEDGFDTLNLTIDSNKSFNKDGFGIYVTNYNDIHKHYRTLNYEDYRKWVKDNESSITECKMAHLHLRASTNYVSPEFIHLWNLNGWYLSHNGTLTSLNNGGDYSSYYADGFYTAWNRESVREIYGGRARPMNDGLGGYVYLPERDYGVYKCVKAKHDQATLSSNVNKTEMKNDSLEYFKLVKDDIPRGNTQSIIDKMLLNRGWGVFLMSNAKLPKFYMMSWNKALKITQFSTGLMGFSSDKLGVVFYKDFNGVRLESDGFYGTVSDSLLSIDYTDPNNPKFSKTKIEQNTNNDKKEDTKQSTETITNPKKEDTHDKVTSYKSPNESWNYRGEW